MFAYGPTAKVSKEEREKTAKIESLIKSSQDVRQKIIGENDKVAKNKLVQDRTKIKTQLKKLVEDGS